MSPGSDPNSATKLPRTLRLDPSDTLIYDPAAAPGEWAVPGGFAFWGCGGVLIELFGDEET
jgi:hypothetical protein